MKISDVILRLTAVMEKEGDIEVRAYAYGDISLATVIDTEVHEDVRDKVRYVEVTA